MVPVEASAGRVRQITPEASIEIFNLQAVIAVVGSPLMQVLGQKQPRLRVRGEPQERKSPWRHEKFSPGWHHGLAFFSWLSRKVILMRPIKPGLTL